MARSCHPFLRLAVVVLVLSLLGPARAGAGLLPPPGEEKKPVKLEKVERSFGVRWFRKEGYKDFFEPRVAFIKRKPHFSETIEYAWRPMEIFDMPHRERIDRVQCLYNRYYFAGHERRLFYGAGVGGNIVLFNQKLKDWAKQHRNIDLQDGVNGLGRLFVGYKVSQITLGKKVYPVVVRVDGFFSPDYRFGGTLGRAGDRLELSEIKADVGLSIE
ncbi:MAG: hypothetical protein OZSIB_1193 [Candidatus Ozemobacter sibiricus]|jgi:hypothetical protein|uniref:Uncharacterized protein n=1 Tax=Candidatus Ozemobacter sibiricus TaxID=2268124 RepID=A0A367ZKN9_9BACT|nr:MAG: hypothetical protein OZSIB_1193 [Candidatus Ozemobacter sibiricus]